MSRRGEVLNAGEVSSEAIVLEEPLSFWGGFDPVTGSIIDRAHPQAGECLTGKVVVMAAARGSSGTPGALGESMRIGTGPDGIVLLEPDINITVGAMVVASLYDVHCPVVVLRQIDYDTINTGDHIAISLDGAVSITP